MRYLSKYKMFESVNEIDEICRKYNIKNYNVNPDGTVDVDGGVDLSHKGLDKIPIKFGEVTGNFFCYDNKITTLEGCPISVGGNFYCHYNKLTTLEGCPISVGDSFICDNNILLTLNGLSDVYIGEYLDCRYNPIHSVTSWLSYRRPDMDLIELFNDIEPIIGNKLYLSKLEYFHEEIGKDLPDMEIVKKYYEIIE